MARARRPLTEAERERSCGFCGARAGERCVNLDGGVYGGTHAARKGKAIISREPYRRDPHENYPVTLCGNCRHPGGQHVVDGGCRLCRDCPGWDDSRAVAGQWNDRKTDELLAAMTGGRDAEHP